MRELSHDSLVFNNKGYQGKKALTSEMNTSKGFSLFSCDLYCYHMRYFKRLVVLILVSRISTLIWI